jgi:hypothetical protein
MVLDCVVFVDVGCSVYNVYMFIEFYNFCLSRTVEFMANDEFERKQFWPDRDTALLGETEERHKISVRIMVVACIPPLKTKGKKNVRCERCNDGPELKQG